MKKISWIFLLAFLLTAFTKPKVFPIINYKTINGTSVTNEFFNEQKSIVILAHLGCPAAMLLSKDLEFMEAKNIQMLMILENTLQQINDFNSPEKNDWSGLRNYYEMKPLTGNIIAECNTSNIRKKDGNVIIGTQCRKLSKKINTKDSPTLIYVDEKGSITKIIK